MQQTFLKTINGHSIQFNRLLYPVQYCVLNNDPKSNGTRFLFEKNEDGIWTVNQTEQIPEWLKEINLDIHNAIQENERTPADVCLEY